ncbi:hypothetical protein L0B53_14805 [Vibrio sp. SS-MA-C1-2]|uniref:hypothetical protein n=1 Tax=Vibrio sp. SS-MA-C1-2 TaxID=2908646 RepID=UPI001F201F7C|nr:hypothetical protein [Vibrio sp. SS-MA-C1-2]UJF18278.1 hypothetical protein L0B53_14805 [Vibrio sp. SS-MA-C1-2]
MKSPFIITNITLYNIDENKSYVAFIEINNAFIARAYSTELESNTLIIQDSVDEYFAISDQWQRDAYTHLSEKEVELELVSEGFKNNFDWLSKNASLVL